MRVEGKDMRSLWYEDETLKLIDQRTLPSKFELFTAKNEKDIAYAIKEMVIRGAPAIGCAAAYGIAMADDINQAAHLLRKTRPTAHDLFYAIEVMIKELTAGKDPIAAAAHYTETIIDKCKKIGEHGNSVIPDNARISV